MLFILQLLQVSLMASKTGRYIFSLVGTPPDKLICQICIHVARTPHQVTCCGRVYCKACLNEHKRLVYISKVETKLESGYQVSSRKSYTAYLDNMGRGTNRQELVRGEVDMNCLNSSPMIKLVIIQTRTATM